MRGMMGYDQMAFANDFYAMGGNPTVIGSSMNGTGSAPSLGASGTFGYNTSVNASGNVQAANGAAVVAALTLIGAFLLLHTR